MKLKRQKIHKRAMALYQNSFNFRTPYQVLVDGDFCQTSLESKIHIKEQLPHIFLGSTKQMVTPCTIAQLVAQGESYTGALLVAKRFERRRCTHNPALSSAECITSIIGDTNPHNYCVASQDAALRAYLRNISGVPMCYIKRSVLVLEPPSLATLENARQRELNKMAISGAELAALTRKRKADEDENLHEPIKKRMRKGPKQPNPLSVKKKKKPLDKGPLERKMTNGDDVQNGLLTENRVNDTASERLIPNSDIPTKKTRKRKKKHRGGSKGIKGELEDTKSRSG